MPMNLNMVCKLFVKITCIREGSLDSVLEHSITHKESRR